MALPTTHFLIGVFFLFYVSTFLIFAILRVTTGVSIQRLGLTSLRRISFVPREGLKLEIRGLGLSVHRPTFARPTWVSVVIEELRLSVDLGVLSASRAEAAARFAEVEDDTDGANGSTNGAEKCPTASKKQKKQRKAWRKLIDIKEHIKRLHRIIPWIKLVDVVAERSSLAISDIGLIQLGTFLVSVDTRPDTVDRSRLFQHSKTKIEESQPAEWTFILRSVLFTPEGKDSMEILDHCVMNIHGFLYQEVEGLRDASLSIKLGRLNVPYDDFAVSSSKASSNFRGLARRQTEPYPGSPDCDIAADATPDAVLRNLKEAKDFVGSVLRGIREISVAVSFLGLSKRINFIRPTGTPMYLNMVMKEVGFDIYRLDPSTPAHSMYFERKDVAHQALLSAISFALGVDDGLIHPQRLVYIPMTTLTLRTTLPAKILQFSAGNESPDRNANVLFANLVITSPAVDLDPRHLPLVVALATNRPKSSGSMKQRGHHMVTSILPRSSIKVSVQEPVVRVALPPIRPKTDDEFQFDLLISHVSSVSLDVESSHSNNDEAQYTMTSILRVSLQRFYYQTAARETHDLIVLDSLEFRSWLTTAMETSVIASANLNTCAVYLMRPEISEGVRQIVQQIHKDVASDKLRAAKKSRNPNFLRSLPTWLTHVQLQVNDFSIELAGMDPRLSSQTRGFALQLEELTTEYKLHKDDVPKRPNLRRRSLGHSNTGETIPTVVVSSPSSATPPSPEKRFERSTDGRRLTVHFKNFQGIIMEAMQVWEKEPLFSIPRAEIAFSTTNDGLGPTFNIKSHCRALYLRYSLFKHYAICVALVMLRKTISRSRNAEFREKEGEKLSEPKEEQPRPRTPEKFEQSSEIVNFDLKFNFVQLKAKMPADPNLLLHVYDLEAGRRRWTNSFAKAHVLRLHAATPAVKTTWTRVISIKKPRVDYREVRHRKGGQTVVERSTDVGSDAIRIGIPHQLVVHHIFDNLINSFKTVKQLHHRFKTETEDYILAKYPESAKTIPKLTVRTHVLLFELEDGAFEWKLSSIYRAGLLEQTQRLAREEAFKLKVERLKRVQRKSATPQGPFPGSFKPANGDVDFGFQRDAARPNQGSDSSLDEDSPRSSSEKNHHQIRYDTEGSCKLSGDTRTSVEDAWDRLQRYNAQSWKKRVDLALNKQAGTVKDLRSLMWGDDVVDDDEFHTETVLRIPQRPALMNLLMSDVKFTLDKPSFPLNELSDFLHRVGKGFPKDMQFGLLIPMHVRFDMGEARMSLRDYPLPLLHIPSIKPGQSPRLASWTLKTDFVVAEEFRDYQSTRDLQIPVIPPEKMHDEDKPGGFAIDVRRTVSPVKTYSDIKISINTARDTRITWGTSYQPAIQDMMQVIEGFSKPQLDPSERVGFWDKIRLSFHSRLNVEWTGDGDVHLMLKGSRDPYQVTGYGAGFVMVWRNNVRWNIWQEEDPMKFMTVDSGDYVLAVPDFSHYARQSAETFISASHDGASYTSDKDGPTFKKVIMKLSGKVRWLAGLVFERDLPDGKRSFNFSPHYDVVLRNPQHVKDLKKDGSYDAFRGFRSNHIHMSIAIMAPFDRDWSVSNVTPADNYNSVHLSPFFFTHFFAWWSTFSGSMSLPVRQGKLFPGVEKSGKKFSRHLATIKYGLLFSPLFIAHVYKHKEPEEFTEDIVSATGLKMRLDSFMLDLHQRREVFSSDVKGLARSVKTSSMKIYQTLLDLVSADIRAISAGMTGTSADAVRQATDEKLAGYQQTPKTMDLAKFTIPDNDFSWIDVDDLVEMDWILPTDDDPETQILPLAYAPRFTYRRNTDHHDTISGDKNRHSPFGNEDTHTCIISPENDSRKIQIHIIKERLVRIDELLRNHDRSVGDHELQILKATEKEDLQNKLNELRYHGEYLKDKRKFLRRMHRDLRIRLRDNDHRGSAYMPELDGLNAAAEPEDSDSNDGNDAYVQDQSFGLVDANNLSDHVSDFNNRFVIHNPQIKWNNPLRNIMLRYIHQVSQRRGFVYYLSRQAVKFILDLVEEQSKSKEAHATQSQSDIPQEPLTPFSVLGEDDELTIQDRIAQLLADGKKFVNADDPDVNDTYKSKTDAVNKVDQDVGSDFAVQNTYHVRLIAPQIQLQSEKNTKSAIIVTARGMRLKVFQIMDKDRMFDEVSGLVQRRFAVEMDNVQFFVTNKKLFNTEFLHMYASNRYGSTQGSAWPPWLPIEAMFDFKVDVYGFSRVVQPTSANIRWDKYNQLRLKGNDNVSSNKNQDQASDNEQDSQMDRLWIDFPQVRMLCDSEQYYAMYLMVVDLLLWSEPLEKTRHERLEKIMLAADFSDLRGAPEMVVQLQERIRQLNEIKTHFHIHEKYLDRQGWEDRINLERDLARCEDELFFIMKAITTSQHRFDDRNESSQSNAVLRYFISASEIVWHLTKDAESPLVEFQLGNATYERTDNSDGSNNNSVEIDRIHGLNLLPNAIYPDIIAPYTDANLKRVDNKDSRMLRINWYKLEAIAGIPVVDHFEINLHPLKIQLERETGKRLFEYIFPATDSGTDESFSPFLVRHQPPQRDDEDEKEEEMRQIKRRESMAIAASKSGFDGQLSAGSLGTRLQPTLKLPKSNRPATSQGKPKNQGLGISGGEQHHRFNLFGQRHPSPTRSVPASATANVVGRTSNDLSSINSRGKNGSKTSLLNGNHEKDHKKKLLPFTSSPRRSPSGRSRLGRHRKDEENTDDLTQMMNRASSYMTLAYLRIPSVVLSLSYKGKGSHNLEDVHNLVFKMPTLEYRNKTWSNLDLAMALKKDVIHALARHTGAILSNKLTHHKPGKTQQSRLREIANSAAVMSSNEVSRLGSAASSVRDVKASERESPRFSNDDASTLSRTESFVSTIDDEEDGQEEEQLEKPATPETEHKGEPLRHTLTRHFSEMTQKARRASVSTAMNSIANSHPDDGDEATPKKQGGLKKFFHTRGNS